MSEHGTRANYLRGCRCDPCRLAHARYVKAYRYRTGATTGPTPRPIRVDATPVIEHVALLRASGLSLCSIAREAGTDSGRLSRIVRGINPRVHPAVADRILAVDPLPDLTGYIDPVTIDRATAALHLGDPGPWRALTREEKAAAGTVLASRGWTASMLARAVGCSGRDARAWIGERAT